jgi:hypothetical protein
MQNPRCRGFCSSFGGERGIRTPGPVTRTTVFETAPIDHSGISPLLVDPDMFWFRDDKNKKLFLLSIFSSNIQHNHFDGLKINATGIDLHLFFARFSPTQIPPTGGF